MAVPGQDERDWAFAEVFDLPIVRTVQPPEGWEGKAYVGEGPAINSANAEVDLNGLGVADAKRRIIDWLEAHRRRRGHRHHQAARLAVQPPAVLGRAVPDRLRPRRRPAAGAARVDAARRAAATSTTTPPPPSPTTTRRPSRCRRWPAPPTGSRSRSTWARARRRTAARRTRCRSGRGRAGTSCATWTPPTTRRSSTPRTSATGWVRSGRATAAASTCTSAAPSTRCCTCCTPASGTRCCTTWATCRRSSRTGDCSTRG